MNKTILTIITVLVLALLGYWFYRPFITISEPKPEQVINTDEENEFEIKGPVGVATNESGEYLVTKSGMTLYVNVKDNNPAGKVTPNCNASCETTWIPFLLGENESAIQASTDPIVSKINLYKRADDKIQYTLGTQPLYTFASDTKFGDMTGTSGDWMVARP